MVKKNIVILSPYQKTLLTVTSNESVTISCDNRDISPLYISENNNSLTTYDYNDLDIKLHYGEEVIVNKDSYIYHTRQDKYDAVTIKCLETEGGKGIVGDNHVDAIEVSGLNEFINNQADISKHIPNNSINATYSTIQAHILANSLIPNQWYRLIDYHNINTSFFDYVHTGNNEVLLLRANSSSTFFSRVISETHPDDIIEYDVTVDRLMDSGDGEWEDNTDSGGDIQFSNWTEHSVEINKYITIDNDFYFSVEDDDGDAEYELVDLGVRFTVTYPTANTSIITILDDAVNFTHPDYNYGELSCTYKVADTVGKITYREYPEKDIKCSFDFRGTAFARKRPDIVAMNTFTSGTVYTEDTTVYYNNRAYNAMVDMTSGANPYTNQWIQVFADIDRSYLHTSGTTGSISIPLESTYKVIPMFSYWNGTDYVEDYERFEKVHVWSDKDILFAKSRQTTTVQDVTVDKYARNLTFGGGVQSMYFNRYANNLIVDLNGNIQNIAIQTSMQSIVMSATCYNIKLISASSCLLGSVSNTSIGNITYCKFKNVVSCTIGSSTNNVHFGYANRSTLGDGGRECYFNKCENSKIGNSYSKIMMMSNIFVNNQIGDLWQNFLINYNFMYNTFGSYIGNSTLTIETKGTWSSNNIGSYCFTANNHIYFNYNVTNNIIGNGCNKFEIDGTMNGSVIGSNVNTIKCKDLYNTNIAPNCHHFTFDGNIAYCTFTAGVNTLTYLSTNQFRYNTVVDGHITFDTACPYVANSSMCKVYKDNGNVRLTSFDNDVNVLIDPTDCSDVQMKIKAPITIGDYTLPATDGTTGQYLTTDGAGTLSWTTP